MESNESKGRWFGILIGPAIVLASLSALWKNETRFDFHRAAAGTQPIESPASGEDAQLISFTDSMDQGLTLPGEYVESFTGYLTIQRHAEIYCWDRDKRDDRVTWDLRWQSSVESNSRNRGVKQFLNSKSFKPANYDVGELIVSSDRIEFVDSSVDVSPASLSLKHERLTPEGEYFVLSKFKPDNLGDERVSYSAIPVPSIATYFGKLQSNQGVADTSHQRTGFVNSIIQDSGILHHLVAGERETALATMKAYITRLKWIVRGIGTAAVVLGFFITFATILGALFHIPILGRIAESGSFLLALAIGLPLAFLTIAASYLFAHPLVLLTIVGSIAGCIYLVRRKKNESQAIATLALEEEYGHVLDLDEVKDLEFMELAQLAIADSNFGDDEEQFLRSWANKHKWDDDKYEQMLAKARQSVDSSTGEFSSDEHLLNLIRLAMADGKVTQYEVKSIRRVAHQLNYDDNTLRSFIKRAQVSEVGV